MRNLYLSLQEKGEKSQEKIDFNLLISSATEMILENNPDLENEILELSRDILQFLATEIAMRIEIGDFEYGKQMLINIPQKIKIIDEFQSDKARSMLMKACGAIEKIFTGLHFNTISANPAILDVTIETIEKERGNLSSSENSDKNQERINFGLLISSATKMILENNPDLKHKISNLSEIIPNFLASEIPDRIKTGSLEYDKKMPIDIPAEIAEILHDLPDTIARFILTKACEIVETKIEGLHFDTITTPPIFYITVKRGCCDKYGPEDPK